MQIGAYCALASILSVVAALWPVLAAENAPIPNFAPDSRTGWLKPPGDEFIPPASGPGPVYRKPPTTQLHVVERFKLVEGGEPLEVNVRVEDPGAFTMPWDAVQR
jgi:hypothetical protein